MINNGEVGHLDIATKLKQQYSRHTKPYVEMVMIWIPIVYFCLTSGDCGFLQGKPTYTNNGCIEQIEVVVKEFSVDDDVVAFDVTCVSVSST